MMKVAFIVPFVHQLISEKGPNGYDVAGSLSKQRVKNVRIYEK